MRMVISNHIQVGSYPSRSLAVCFQTRNPLVLSGRGQGAQGAKLAGVLAEVARDKLARVVTARVAKNAIVTLLTLHVQTYYNMG
jgi:hypothetical protein